MIDTIKEAKTGRARSNRFVTIIITTLFVVLISASISFAQEQAIVFYLDKTYYPVVNLERLQPVSEGMKAILAMYALQVGGGCQGHDESGLRCILTTELGLGAQCSSQHINLVHTWFKKGIPKMSGYYSSLFGVALKSEVLQDICYNAPEGAKYQEIWEIIRVRQKDDLVFINAISSWTAGADGPTGRKRYESVYRIGPHDVSIVSHKEVSPKKGKTK
jgi:hypothetical protein